VDDDEEMSGVDSIFLSARRTL